MLRPGDLAVSMYGKQLSALSNLEKSRVFAALDDANDRIREAGNDEDGGEIDDKGDSDECGNDSGGLNPCQ